MKPAYAHTATDGSVHYLHGKTVILPGSRRQLVVWFARQATPAAALEAPPVGYRITESPRTHRPYLRKA
jgi:hypothetical protein